MGDLLRRRELLQTAAAPAPDIEYATSDVTVSIQTSMMLPSNAILLYEMWFIPDNDGQWTSIGRYNSFLGFEKRNVSAIVFNRNSSGTRYYTSVSYTGKEVWSAVEVTISNARAITIARYNLEGAKKTGSSTSNAETPTEPFSVRFMPNHYIKRISMRDATTGEYYNDIRIAVNNGRVCLHDLVTGEYFYDAQDRIYLANPPE